MNCTNCGKPVQKSPGEIATHINGFVYCNLTDLSDRRVALIPKEKTK